MANYESGQIIVNNFSYQRIHYRFAAKILTESSRQKNNGQFGRRTTHAIGVSELHTLAIKGIKR